MRCRIALSLFIGLSSSYALGNDIFQAVEGHDIRALSLLTNDIRRVNSLNSSGYTPIMIAARNGDVAMVKMLIDAGADLSICNKGFTVRDQLESYLRRTGDSRNRIESMLNDIGIGQSMIRSFQRESDALGGSPERIQSWKTIHGLVCAHMRVSLACQKNLTSRISSPCDQLPDSGTAHFETEMGRWLESISWSKGMGFSLKLRDKDSRYRRSLPLLLKGEKYWKAASGGETLTAEHGIPWILTNGRGRTYTILASAPTDTVHLAGRQISLPDAAELLTLELKERISRDGKTAQKTYVILSSGKMLEGEDLTFREVSFPLMFHAEDGKDQSRQGDDVRKAAMSNKLMAAEEKICAEAALTKIAGQKFGLNITNEYCYSAQEDDETENIRRMTKMASSVRH